MPSFHNTLQIYSGPCCEEPAAKTNKLRMWRYAAKGELEVEGESKSGRMGVFDYGGHCPLSRQFSIIFEY